MMKGQVARNQQARSSKVLKVLNEEQASSFFRIIPSKLHFPHTCFEINSGQQLLSVAQ